MNTSGAYLQQFCASVVWQGLVDRSGWMARLGVVPVREARGLRVAAEGKKVGDGLLH